MMRLTSVVLPAPVGPTIAIVCPGSATSDRCSISGRCGSYENVTSRNSTRPSTGGSTVPEYASGSCSSASRNSTTRSNDAMPDWKTFIIDASWVSGIEKLREYWMNAWMPPIEIPPFEYSRPPKTATITYCTLPMNIVSGCIRLDMNCAPNDDWNSSSLVFRNCSSTSRWRPNDLTTAWPVNVSSM